MKKVDFVYIGPDKSGSTWLYMILRQHPAVYIPDAKDIYFFDRYYSNGLEWYHAFFKKGFFYNKIVGEISHDYLFSELAAQRLFAYNKNLKIITTLRHPVEKAFSLYLFGQRNGLISKNESFLGALKKRPEIISRSLYGKHLNYYYKLFDKDMIGVFLFDNLNADPKQFAYDIFDFLNINHDETIDYTEKTLQASKPRSYLVSKMAKKMADLLRKLGLINLLGKIKTNKMILSILYKKLDNKPQIKQEEYEYLMENFFNEDIHLLEQITKKDFSQWKKY